MNFGAEWPWWWNALMQVGGFFEMTAPVGIAAFVAFAAFAIWVNVDGDGSFARRIRRWRHPGIENEGK